MDLLTLVSFVFFTALVGVLTWVLTRHDRHDTNEGYFLAGRTLTGGYIAGSLLLTNLSTEQLVGLNGQAFTDGLSVMAWEVLAGASLVVMGLFFLPRYLKSGVATVPEYLAERFDHHTRTITSLIFIVAYSLILLPIILYTGATGLIGILDFSTITGITNDTTNLWIAVWLIGIIGSLYAIFGGLRTVAVSDTLNGFGLLVGGFLILWFGLCAVGSGDALAGLDTLMESHPEKFNSIGAETGLVPFSTLFTGVPLLGLFYWCTNQQIIQRALGASTLKEGQKGVLLAGWLKVLAPLILVLPGIIAFHLYAADHIERDHAYGTLVRDVLPAPLAGFFAAVMVGAILSSFNSALNSTATLFSLGVYKDLLHPTASDAQVIRAGKVMGAVVAIAAMLGAPALAGQKSIFDYLQQMNGLYAVPVFAVVLIGMTTHFVPAIAANMALICGCCAIAFGYFVPAVSGFIGTGTDQLHPFHFLGVVFAALIAFMLLVGRLKPRATAWEQKSSGDVDLTPWPLARPIGALLILFALSVYVFFADFSVLD